MFTNTGNRISGLLNKNQIGKCIKYIVKSSYGVRKAQAKKKSCESFTKDAEKNVVLGIAEQKTRKTRKKRDEKGGDYTEFKIRDMDLEAIWRDNLTSDNLKLFFKTDTGKFRKIRNDESFVKLKSVLNEKEDTDISGENENKPRKVTITVEIPCEKKEKDRSPNLRLPNLLIRNMTNFPMVRCNNTDQDGLTEELKNAEVNSYSFPSVTRILSDTKSEESVRALKKWEEKLVAKLGPEGFLKYRQALLDRGSKFHTCIKQFLEVKDERAVEVDADTEGVWKSVQNVLSKISDVRHLEEDVAHPILLYKGIVDCVASYEDVPYVIEWKKSDRKKSSISATYDAPLQCCAYLGALAWSKQTKDPVTNGLVVVAYTDGSPADTYKMDSETCSTYWLHWLQRLQYYWVLHSKKS